MKSFFYYLLIILIGISINSCLKDSTTVNYTDAKYGKCDTMYFYLSYSNAKISKNNAPIKINEEAINNTNIFIFNELGDLVFRHYNISSNKIENVQIYEKMKHKIYVIANAGEEIKVKNENELLSLNYKIENMSQITDAYGGCIMCGKSNEQILNNGQTINIELIRAISKITIKCDYTELNPNVDLKIKSIQIFNIPNSISYFNKNKIELGSESISSEIKDDNSLTELAKQGISFYIYENIQGELTPSANNNKDKANLLSTEQRRVCSYFYMIYDYKDVEKKGSIKYTGFLGNIKDCNVERNKHYTYNIAFKGNASRDEMSVSVDNSDLQDRLTSIALNPSTYTFTELDKTKKIDAIISPITAYDTRLIWTSSQPNIATVNNYGQVRSVANGSCTITATSVDNPHIKASCDISVNYNEPDPIIELDEYSKIMYDGEISSIKFKNLNTSKIPNVTSSNPLGVEILEVNKSEIKIKAKTTGIYSISASIGNTVATCNIDVQLLRIELPKEITCYSTFKHNIAYTIYPEHARGLALKWEYRRISDILYYSFANNPASNTIIGEKVSNNANIKVSFLNFPTKVYITKVNVKEAISIRSSIKAAVNMGKGDLIEDLNLETAPNANVVFTWETGNPGKYILVNSATNKITFVNPNGINGEYILKASVIGDNGIKSSVQSIIEVYETVYLVGVSKFLDRELIKYDNPNQTKTYKYSNEIVAKWLAHPNSIRFPSGEIGSNLFSFYYNDVKYYDDHTDMVEESIFTFGLNERVALAWDLGYYIGAPPRYIEYFYLRTDSNGYQYSPQYGYIYVLSRNFGGGFADQNVDWKIIFQYIYK